jgi:formate dehydrogenase iron-sulfur subunit
MHLEGSYQHPMDLNGDTRLIITFDEREGGFKGVEWAFGRRSCQHCTDAACVGVCPTGALSKDEETGMVVPDDTKCIGCHYCSMACPYDVPRYYGENALINKCTGCTDRTSNGLDPACVTTCQPNALEYGDRDEMISRAHERVERLKARGWENACVYGENEMGGLHVIQVLKYGVEQHGQIENPSGNGFVSASEVMKPVTGVLTGVTVAGLAAMFALGAGYKRDKLVYNEKTGDTINVETGEVVKHGDGQDEMSVKEHIFGKNE